MSAATVSLPDMGEWNITSQIKIDGQIAPDFSFDWEVVFQGHKYIQPLRKPQGAKENTTLNSVIDLTFQHWAQYQLKRWYFFAIQPSEAGVAWPDKYIASVSLNLGDFCTLFETILNYYYGDKITLSLNPQWQYKSEAEVVEISYSHIWDVLIKLYEVYGVRWVIEPNGSPDKYVIKVGYPTTEQSHIFEYGFEGGLLKVERQVQSEEIANMLLGRGGEKNLPYRYFKNVDPENPSFPADPDWVEELANIYFSNLMPATFRSYVQGWKAAHLNAKDKDGKLLYEGYEAVGEDNAYAPWAYRKGFTDEKFDPVEYVADEITINPETGDKIVVISPTYSPYVKKDSSIAKYGALLNGLENNDEIYPTIQGVVVDPYGRIDEAVEVEPITSDDVEEAAENDAQITTVGGFIGTATKVGKSEYRTFTAQGATFTVPSGKRANLDVTPSVRSVSTGNRHEKIDIATSAEITDYSIKVYGTNGEVSASGIPSGAYRYEVTVTVHNMTTDKTLNITVADYTPKLISATPSDKWSNVWRIWVKNIWQTSKKSGETDAEYAARVWRPILGDREGNEAKVVFASGLLAHEDYEFVITSIPKYERKLCKWQTVENGKVVEHEYYSEWCIELGKSDADLESLGVYLPSTMRQAVAGDFFFFIGIDMPHLYTVWAEERVDAWKKDNLKDKSDIKPTWVVQTDRVRLNGEGKEDALIRKLHPGDTLRLADKRFIDGVYETLYLQSLTYTYREPSSDDAALNPDVEMVLSDSYSTSASPVATLQSEIDTLTKQVGAISNIEQIVRAVGDKLYLRKDGIADRSYSPTEFASLLTSMGFRSGLVGGEGWGVYKDANGNWVIEADRLMARQELDVNTLVINQVTGQGGTTVESAARMEITNVIERTNGYACYFDQKEGTVANLFHVDDVAWNNRFTPENEDEKFYKRRVVEVGEDYVVLSKTDVNGKGIPEEGDVIVQYGNYTDKTRQYVKVRDVIGGGYERYVEGLDSVNSNGVEYYFVGRQDGQNPRWFIGNKDLVPHSGKGDGSFIEYKNRVFNLNNVVLSVGSKIGDKTINELVESLDNSKYLREALNQSTVIDNGLVLTSAILLGYTNDLGDRVTTAGHNGLYQNPKTIASWWGGDMIDKFYDADGNELETPLTKGFASALVRMDGSAYWANGNIGFNANGSGWLGNYENGIRFGADGSLVLGHGLSIALNGSQEGLASTLESVLNQNIGIGMLFAPIDKNGKELAWKDAANAVAIKAKKNFVGVGEITAYGADGSSSGGSNNFGYLRELLDVNISLPLDGQMLVYRNGRWVNESVAYGGGGIDEAQLASYLSRYGYVTSSVLGNYVTLDTAQEIAGLKTFTDVVNVSTDGIAIGGNIILRNNGAPNNNTVLSSTGGDLFLRPCGTFDSTGEVRIKPNGTITAGGLNTNTLNVSSNALVSNLNADMLDGLHSNQFMRESVVGKVAMNANDLFAAWTIYRPNHDLNVNTAAWTNFPGSKPPGGFSLINLQSGNYKHQLYLDYNYNNIFIRRQYYNNGVLWSGWTKLVNEQDNIASASKLQTARSLWGNSFTGEGDVNGGLTFGLLSGTAGRNLLYQQMADNDYFRIYCGGTATNGGYAEIATADDGNEPIYVRQYSGAFSTIVRTLILLDGNGNTSFPGDINSVSAPATTIYMKDWYRSIGSTGWYNQSYGGGIYMSDTTWVRVYNNKSFYTSANILAGGEITAYSDARLKSDIKPLQFRTPLKPKTYIKDGKKQIGFIAQDVQENYPELVQESNADNNNYLSLNYNGLIAVLAAQLNEMENKITKLENEIKELKGGLHNGEF